MIHLKIRLKTKCDLRTHVYRISNLIKISKISVICRRIISRIFRGYHTIIFKYIPCLKSKKFRTLCCPYDSPWGSKDTRRWKVYHISEVYKDEIYGPSAGYMLLLRKRSFATYFLPLFWIHHSFITIRKSNGESTHPCRTPRTVLKGTWDNLS